MKKIKSKRTKAKTPPPPPPPPPLTQAQHMANLLSKLGWEIRFEREIESVPSFRTERPLQIVGPTRGTLHAPQRLIELTQEEAMAIAAFAFPNDKKRPT